MFDTSCFSKVRPRYSCPAWCAVVLLPLVCWLANSPKAHGATVTRGPYLQQATPHGIIVKWRTDVSTRSLVRFGTVEGQYTTVVSNSTLVTTHSVQLTNLLPQTRYFYQIGSGSTWFPRATDTFFVTSPRPGQEHPTRIWVIGDSGTADNNAAAVRNAYRNIARTRQADLWLMLGDNAYNSGTDAEYQEAVFEMYPDILRNTPLWPTIGNHETTVTPYLSIFSLPQQGQAGGVGSGTERYYSFDYGSVHFICLDSWSSDRGSNAPMATWLQSDLESTTQPWLIAFWHHPPYTRGSHDSDRETELVAMRRNIVPLLESYGVDLVLCGHSHSYERSFLLNGHYGTSGTLIDSMLLDDGDGRESGDGAYRKSSQAARNGAVYVVAGSSGKISGGDLDHPAMFISLNVLGSLIIDVASNRLDLTFLRTNGAAGDWFTLIKERAATNPPAGPSSLVATAFSSSRIELSWRDQAVDEVGFELERSTNGVDFAQIAEMAANATNTSDDSLLAGTTYYYRVRAFNGFGHSPYSNVGQATTLPPAPSDTTAPAAVTNLFVSSLTSNNLTLTWAAPGDDGTVGIAHSYDLRYSHAPITEANFAAAPQATDEPLPEAPGTWQSLTVGGLTPGDVYHFALVTSDESQNRSPISNVPSAVPTAPVISTGLVLLASNSVWRYLDNGSGQAAAWRAAGFDDTVWGSGPAKLGYGFGDEATVVSYGPSPGARHLTTWFRKTFTIHDPRAYSNVLVQLLRDDGAVVHINGIEVYRSNMPDGPITYRTAAARDVSGSGSYRFYPRSIMPAVLVAGTNVVAVELHQSSASSPDLAFDLQLTAVERCGELPPTLSITRQDNNVLVTWPDICPAASFSLEWAPTIDSSSLWSPASGVLEVTNGLYQMRLPIDQPQAIYRLHRRAGE